MVKTKKTLNAILCTLLFSTITNNADIENRIASKNLEKVLTKREQSAPKPTKEMLSFMARRVSSLESIDGIAMTYFRPDDNKNSCYPNTFNETSLERAVPVGNKEYFGGDAHIFMFVDQKPYEGHLLTTYLKDIASGEVLLSANFNLRNIKYNDKELRLFYMNQFSVPCYAKDILERKLNFSVSGKVGYSIECHVDGRNLDSKLFFINFDKVSDKTEKEQK